MRLDSVTRPLSDSLSGRFALVGYLPTFAAVLTVLVLVWAGAPEERVRFDRAWQTAADLGIGEIVLLGVASTLLSLVLQPMQLPLVRLLEGGWPGWAGSGIARRWQLRRRLKLAERAEIPDSPLDDATTQRIGAAGALLRRRYPQADHLVRPTALGNVLTAMEDGVGQSYGLDTAVVWPRLYPVLGDGVRALVDDRRDALDLSVRLSATGGVLACVMVGLLARSGWWLLLALIPLAVAGTAYRAAVHAAVGYGETVATAFDLHRFELLRALHLPLPADNVAEAAANRELSLFWRQGRPPQWEYEHPEG